MTKKELSLEERNKLLSQRVRELEILFHAVSHDLQPPIRSALYNLKKLDQDHPNYQKAYHHLKTLNEMISALFQYSCLDSHELVLEKCNLRECLNQALLNLDAAIQEKKANITISPHYFPSFYLHKPHLISVFQNGLENAIKYHKPGEPPDISIGVKNINPEGWEIWIQDQGIGIPSQHAPEAFQIFQRLHGEENYKGIGLGLAQTRKIMKKFGGDVCLSGKEGKGASLHYYFPLRDTENPVTTSTFPSS